MPSNLIEAYPGCPTLTWVIAQRVCNKYEQSDAFISFVGRKGSGKSTASLAFCEGLSEDIARIHGRGAKPEDFFNIDHVRTITKTGAIEIMTSGVLEKTNSIILLDDAGTQWSNRAFATKINQYLNQILQIIRVYQGVVVANFIMADHIDKQAREMTDYRAQMIYKNSSTQQALFKFYYLEQGKDQEYAKYLTWHNKRVKSWVIGLPSKELYDQYKMMRKANTDQFIKDAKKEVKTRYLGFAAEEKVDHRIKDPLKDPVILQNKDRVIELLYDPSFMKKNGEPNENKIAKEVCIGRQYIGRIAALHRQGKFNGVDAT